MIPLEIGGPFRQFTPGIRTPSNAATSTESSNCGIRKMIKALTRCPVEADQKPIVHFLISLDKPRESITSCQETFIFRCRQLTVLSFGGSRFLTHEPSMTCSRKQPHPDAHSRAATYIVAAADRTLKPLSNLGGHVCHVLKTPIKSGGALKLLP